MAKRGLSLWVGTKFRKGDVNEEATDHAVGACDDLWNYGYG